MFTLAAFTLVGLVGLMLSQQSDRFLTSAHIQRSSRVDFKSEPKDAWPQTAEPTKTPYHYARGNPPPSTMPPVLAQPVGKASPPSRMNRTRWDVFIVIPSASKERDRRDAIRASWTKMLISHKCERCLQSKVAYRFVVGAEGDVAAAHREAEKFGDVGILHDFKQVKAYTKRSEKTLRSIRYAVQHFDFKFLLKCDTDSWVYLDRLLHHFDANSLWTKDKLYAGRFKALGQKPVANNSSKWYDPVYGKITGFQMYPKHAKGAGYVLSRSLAEGLARQPLDFWAFIPCEDTAVGFWLIAAEKQIYELPVVSWNANCAEGIVIDHAITPEIMRVRFKNLSTPGAICGRGTDTGNESTRKKGRGMGAGVGKDGVEDTGMGMGAGTDIKIEAKDAWA